MEDDKNNPENEQLDDDELVHTTPPISAVEHDLLGQEINGKYKILEIIGNGGMGVVFKARQTFIDRLVAIKVLHANLVTDDVFLSRFKREARVASKLNSSYAATIYDYGLHNNLPYIAMEYVEGETLKDKITKEGALPLNYVVEMLEQICRALEEAHALGIVHRDLKPENIMICKGRDGVDRFKVLDFGVAKLITGNNDQAATVKTCAGQLFGTPKYASPEQVLGRELDSRSDIYSLGVILYQALSGYVPFDAPSVVEMLFKHVNEKPRSIISFRPSLRIPKTVDDLVLKCLAKDPSQRFQKVEDLTQELRVAMTDSMRIKHANSTSPFVFVGLGIMGILMVLVIGALVTKQDVATKPIEAGVKESAGDVSSVVSSASMSAAGRQEPTTTDGLGQIVVVPKKEGLSAVSSISSDSQVGLGLEGIRLSEEQKTALFEEATELYKGKNYTAAIIKFEELIKSDSKNKKALLSLGVCYQRLGKLDQAFKEFEAALAIDATYAPTYFNLACLYAVTGNSDYALDNLRRAINYEPRAKQWAERDKDLESLRGHPKFKELVGK